MQADGKILIAGSFTNVSGTARNHIARLNTDGTLDLRFDPNANQEVNCVSVQTDGKIVVAGSTDTFNVGDFEVMRLLGQ